jgi:hypothetical protein
VSPDEAGQVWTVDRIEGDVVVLVEEEGEGAGRVVDVPRRELGVQVEEGSVLRVPASAGGEPDWARATLDEALRRTRVEEARRMLNRLKGRDPGGDVEL